MVLDPDYYVKQAMVKSIALIADDCRLPEIKDEGLLIADCYPRIPLLNQQLPMMN
jgi:hypothetical protein